MKSSSPPRSIGEETDRLSQLAEIYSCSTGSTKAFWRSTTAKPIALDELLDGVARASGVAPARPADRSKRTAADSSFRGSAAPRAGIRDLIDNALRYGSGTIRLFAVEHQPALEIHVTDEGTASR